MADEAKRIDIFLAEDERIRSRAQAQRLILLGQVSINGRLAQKNMLIKVGDEVIAHLGDPNDSKLAATDIKLSIKYEDDNLMVISKQAGLTTHPTTSRETDTLINALIFSGKRLANVGGPLRPGIVHRLDKETSGLLVIAKDDKTFDLLVKAIKERKIKRSYLALVHGQIDTASGKIDAPIGRSSTDRKKMSVTGINSKDAISYFEVIDHFDQYTLLKVDLNTGRTHQIRVHMKYIGHPIVGDKQYGTGSEEANLYLGRQFLHAYRLEFDHPISGQRLIIEDDLPTDLKETISRVSKRQGK